jgi:hypothetical protein
MRKFCVQHGHVYEFNYSSIVISFPSFVVIHLPSLSSPPPPLLDLIVIASV